MPPVGTDGGGLGQEGLDFLVIVAKECNGLDLGNLLACEDLRIQVGLRKPLGFGRRRFSRTADPGPVENETHRRLRRARRPKEPRPSPGH